MAFHRAFAMLLLGAFFTSPVWGAQSTGTIPDFSGYWGRDSFELEQPPAGPGPLLNTARRPNGLSDFLKLVGDYKNPILKPKAVEEVKRLGDISIGGQAYPNPQNQCWPFPPTFLLFFNLGMEIFQQKDEITFVYKADHQVRRVRMNQPHPAHVAPSWYGDSVGHYEGDTLVVDTVGIKIGPLSMLDIYGTPYSEALHLIERYRLIDGGAAKQAVERHENTQGRLGPAQGYPTIDSAYKGPGLQVQIQVEDNDVFTTPWSAFVTLQRVADDWAEYVCAENTRDFEGRTVGVPYDDTPDF